MSKRLDKLRNINEANRVLENRFLNEQKAGTAPTPAKGGTVKMVTKTIDSDSLYKTGESTFDPYTNKTFKDTTNAIVNSIMNPAVSKPAKITIQGGASAVGSPRFDNKKLADDRSVNMENYLVQAINFGLEQKTGKSGQELNKLYTVSRLPSVVGKATVKDSPEAKKEQFVKVSYPSVGVGATPPTTAVDTTATGAAGSKETAQQMMDLKTKGMTPMGSKDDVEKMTKGMKSVVIRTSDGKSVYKFTQEQYNELNNVLKKYNMFMPSSIVKAAPEKNL